jgi:hypothetical protein
MKLPIVFASCVLIAVVSVSSAQQPSPNGTLAPRGKAQQQQHKKKTGLVDTQPNTKSQLAIQGRAKRSTPKGIREQALNPPSHDHGAASVQPKQNAPSYSEALRRYRHERHNRVWWKRHYTTIVLVGGGYYYWDAGYWCPAWGYDPAYQLYDYDGPIYTYGNLLPDQVIANVQRALQQLGYYAGGISGALSSATRSAIAAYQEDNGLDVTAVVDAETVAVLGLI